MCAFMHVSVPYSIIVDGVLGRESNMAKHDTEYSDTICVLSKQSVQSRYSSLLLLILKSLCMALLSGTVSCQVVVADKV